MSTNPPVSDTTAALIDLLRQRDAAGRAKYGATLDRTDLTHAQWLQHMAEELLDGAGYALAALRTLPAHFATAEAGDLRDDEVTESPRAIYEAFTLARMRDAGWTNGRLLRDGWAVAVASRAPKPSAPLAPVPAPNWCPTCDRHFNDPAGLFCIDLFHRPLPRQRNAGRGGE